MAMDCEPGAIPEDINGGDDVNLFDFVELVDNWLKWLIHAISLCVHNFIH